jgi:hypothetical protein
MPRKPKSPKPPDPEVEVFSLYGGQVELRFKEKTHRTTVIDCGQTIKPGSVTTILGSLEKHGLVEWGVRCCADYVEKGLNDLFAGSSFSVDAIYKIVAASRQAHNVVRQEAADIGTLAHDWLETHWKSVLGQAEPPVLPAEDGPVRNCIIAAQKWMKEHTFQPLYVERPFYSRKHKFTGKEDLAALVDGRLSIVDYKSSPKLYPEVRWQMAAYGCMYEEEFGQPIVDRWAVRLGKYDGEFEPKKFGQDSFARDVESFLSVLRVYEDLKIIRRKEKPDDSWLQD